MVGTSDQSCWLAEACKILFLGSVVAKLFAMISDHRVAVWAEG